MGYRWEEMGKGSSNVEWMQMTGGVDSSDEKLKFRGLKLFGVATFLTIVCMDE
jgi:hypothetical protein